MTDPDPTGTGPESSATPAKRRRIPGARLAGATIGGTKAFSAGLGAAFRGATLLARTPKWWPYAIAPVVVALGFFVAVAWWITTTVTDLIQAEVEGWFGEVATFVVTGTAIVVSLIVFYFAFSTFVRLVAAPFLAIFSERVYMRVSGMPSPTPPGTRLRRWLLRPIWEALVFLVVRLAVMVLAAPLLCIPVAGPILYTAALLPVEGMDLMDLALSARAVPLSQRFPLIWKNKAATGGLGLGATAVLFVPVVNVFMLPALVVGAVLLDQQVSPDFLDQPGGGTQPPPTPPGELPAPGSSQARS